MSFAEPPPEVIRLTTENPWRSRLTDPMGTAERRSPLCGSRVIIDVNLAEDGRVSEVGTLVNACAFGQAAATLLARHLVGRSLTELVTARDDLAGWIAGSGSPPAWPDIEHLRPDRLNQVRKGSVQLAFQAAVDAATLASAKLN